MSERLFARQGLGFVMTVPRMATELAVSHLSRSRGDLQGQLRVTCGLPGTSTADGHIHQARVNLSSTTSRNTVAKALQARASILGLDWMDLLEDFCRRVMAAETAGSPIVRVGNLPSQPAMTYRVAPLIPRDKTSIIFGAGGTGKSYLAVALAVSVASGRPLMAYQPDRAPVLYLDWETDQYEIDGRVKEVSAGLGIDAPGDFHYRSCAGSLDDMTEDVARFVTAEGVGLVVVDSVGMASATAHDGSDANESTIKMFTALRFFGTTILAVDHVTGADVMSPKGAAKPYGSIYKVNLARSVFELRSARLPDDDGTIHLALYHRKVNGGRLQPATGIAVRHGVTTVTFTAEEIHEQELEMGLSISKRLERALRTGPMTDEELAEDIGEPLSNVRSKLSYYSRTAHPLFRKVDAKWHLAQTNNGVNNVIGWAS